MSPTRRAKTERRSSKRFWGEFSTGDVQELNREIEEHLRWEAGVTHDAAEPRRSSRAENARQLCG